jgi:hypothetical protein
VLELQEVYVKFPNKQTQIFERTNLFSSHFLKHLIIFQVLMYKFKILDGLFQSKKIIVVQINEFLFLINKAVRHLRAPEVNGTHIIRHRPRSNFLWDDGG